MGYDGTLHEGLTKSESPSVAISLINKWVPGADAELFEEHNTAIAVNFTTPFGIKHLLQFANMLGYFPSYIWVDNEGDAWNDEVENELSLLKEEFVVMIKFEAKYDIELSVIPKFGYHITNRQKLDKIKNTGLSPKAGGKLSPHPDRVYLAYNEDDAKKLLPAMSKHITDFALLKVALHGIRGLRLFSDPNFFRRGFYSLVNIPPDRIVDIKILT